MAIPLGVLGAIYLNEYGKTKPLARFIRTMADVMTGVPSIVMGLFIYVVSVLTFEERSGFAGALALACLMLPVVIRSTEEILRLVPDELRPRASRSAPGVAYHADVVLPAGHLRHHQRRAAGHRPRRRRDRAADRDGGRHVRGQPEPVRRENTRCRRRSTATPPSRSRPRRSGPGARR
jgi:hypothetical protein